MPMQTLYLLWAAILSSPVMMGGIGWFLLTPQNAIDPVLLWVLAGAAFALSIAAQTVPVLLIASIDPPVVFILRWAMLEGIAVFGVIARVLGAPIDQFLAFIVASLFMLVLNRPKKETLDALAELKERQRQSSQTGA